MVHSAGNQKSVVHEPFFTLSLDIKVRLSQKSLNQLNLFSFQDPKIATLDDALLRFCEQSTVSDYIDSKNRQNVSHFETILLKIPIEYFRFIPKKPC